MAQTALDRIRDRSTTLDADEAARYEAFHSALLSAGLVTRLRTPRTDHAPERRLIEAQGAPVSQTILEERR